MPLDIVQAETLRLENQKKTIDDELSSQRRLLLLNESYKKRTYIYTNIAIVILVAALSVGIISMFPLPISLTYALILVVVIVAFSLILVYNNKLSLRSQLDFDELDLNSVGTGETKYTGETAKIAQAEAQSSGNISDTVKGHVCVGAECCPNNWDPQTGLCKMGFTTLTDAYISGDIPVAPYSAPPSNYGLDAYAHSQGLQYISV